MGGVVRINGTGPEENMGYGSKSISDWAEDIHALAIDRGWWDGQKDGPLTPEQINSKIMLAVTELSEAVERVRADDFHPQEFWREGEKPDGFGVEIGDAIIRLLDLTERLKIDIEKCIREKHSFNHARPYRHGGKRA